MLSFSVERESSVSKARAGMLSPRAGVEVPTPAFMPIGTRGAVRSMTMADMAALDFHLILANTYHLADRPGTERIAAAGGFHAWTGWNGALLTDSGGFQAYSLADKREYGEEGVNFSSVTDGRAMRFTPESVVDEQLNIGSDIQMVLDVCLPLPATRDALERAAERTTRWAERAKRHWESKGAKNNLFAIVQGGADEALRRDSAASLVALDFPGYAIGGLAVGESAEDRVVAIAAATPLLPADKPRYLMGVGYPEDIVAAVREGVDMFDCVIPTREARHGRLYRFSEPGTGTELWPGVWYEKVSAKAESRLAESGPVDASDPALAAVRWDYLRYLYSIDDANAQRFGTYQNLKFYRELMRRMRAAIEAGIF